MIRQPFLIPPTTCHHIDIGDTRWHAPRLLPDGSWCVEKARGTDVTLYRFMTWPDAEEFWGEVRKCISSESP